MTHKKIFLPFFFVITILLSLNLQAKVSEIPAIVSPSWLEKNYNDKNLVIVDLRPSAEYNKMHIKNAVNIPGLENLFDKKFLMPKLDFLKEVFSKAGINSKSLVLAYDNGEFIWASRFYWILETLGHTNVGVLKVGFNESLKKVAPLSNKTYTPKRSEFVPRVDNEKVQTKLSTYMAIGKKTIIDGRKRSHYEGKESLASRFGHIPTAKNYACTQNYQVTSNGNEIKDLDKLKKIYKDIPKDKEIILYCDGGAEAALNYIVLQELGYKASVYDGSWLEWGNDNALPIDNPSKK